MCLNLCYFFILSVHKQTIIPLGLEVRCEYDLASSQVKSGLELSTELFNEGSAETLAPPPNISLRIAGRNGGDVYSAKVGYTPLNISHF